MAKTWSADNPKAALMARKRAAIVDAALKAFLEAGYAEASVNRIAAAAGVSIKTVRRILQAGAVHIWAPAFAGVTGFLMRHWSGVA